MTLDDCTKGQDIFMLGKRVHVCDAHEDMSIYVAARVGSIPASGGSTEHTCNRCGEKVSVSPAGQSVLAKREMEVVCTPCIQPLGADNEAAESFVIVMTSAQLKEILDGIKAEFSRQAGWT